MRIIWYIILSCKMHGAALFIDFITKNYIYFVVEREKSAEKECLCMQRSSVYFLSSCSTHVCHAQSYYCLVLLQEKNLACLQKNDANVQGAIQTCVYQSVFSALNKYVPNLCAFAYASNFEQNLLKLSKLTKIKSRSKKFILSAKYPHTHRHYQFPSIGCPSKKVLAKGECLHVTEILLSPPLFAFIHS